MEAYVRRIMSGEARGIVPAFVRAALRIIEPIYAAVTSSRNAMYRSGTMKTHRASRPVISIGNITTGGTGKTPVVCWLADKLRERGKHPAVLMRGYKAAPGTKGDEQTLLEELLNQNRGRGDIVPVHAQPDRVAGAAEVARVAPSVDVFILDDGFQHRRLYRDFDLVLIDATNPFGFDHVLPRGLLREPLHGLRRASAILITRVDQALPDALEMIEETVTRVAPGSAIYRCRHAQTSIVDANDSGLIGIEALRGRKVFAFCGIGNPQAFEQQLKTAGANVVGRRQLRDHARYDASDVKRIIDEAKRVGADVLVTTDKDWVKLAPLRASFGSMALWRVQLRIQFLDDDEERLLVQILGAIDEAR